MTSDDWKDLLFFVSNKINYKPLITAYSILMSLKETDPVLFNKVINYSKAKNEPEAVVVITDIRNKYMSFCSELQEKAGYSSISSYSIATAINFTSTF